MLGKWITRAAWGAEVLGQLKDDGTLLGYVIYQTEQIPTHWDADGNSTNKAFTLIKRLGGYDGEITWSQLKGRVAE